MGCGDVAGSFQDHRLEDNEPLIVPPPVPHPLQLGAEHPDEPADDLVYSTKGFARCTFEHEKKIRLHYHIGYKGNIHFWGK